MKRRILFRHSWVLLFCMCFASAALAQQEEAQEGRQRGPRQQEQQGQQNQPDIYIPRTVFTMSEVLDALDAISLGVVLEAPVGLEFNRFDNNYLLSLTNYLDFNVIGLGRSATIFPRRMIDYIIGQLQQGRTLTQIGQRLPDEFQRLELVSLREQSTALSRIQENEDSAIERPEPRISIGGLFLGALERYQDPDASWRTLLEINQLRIFFSAQVNPAARVNRLNFLAEWMPVPEEIIHQIDEIVVVGPAGQDTIITIRNPVVDEIPFQQLYFEITNMANTGLNFRVGQFRLPFGLWSDVTSHRNFSSAKSNTLVNGFALKKIELGALLQYQKYGLDVQIAVIHGRQTRTIHLDRVDRDDRKDFVSRFGITSSRLHLGASAYVSEFKARRNFALGGDFLIPSRRLNISGEFVYQKNNNMPVTFGKPFQFTTAKSISGYMQFDASLTAKFHFYGFYEGWRYYIDDTSINDPAYKLFHGIRINFNRNVRWTVVEYGRMLHHNFDDGENHIGSQIEFTY